MVSRFRENLASGAGVEDSTRIALRYSGRAIFLSGATTAIGFSALLFVPVAELRSVAIGGLVVIVMTVLLATTLLPAVLLWLGSRINMGQTRVRLIGTEVSAGWRWWSRFSLRHRFWVVTLSGLGLLAAMWPVKDVSLSFAYQDWLPRQAEAVRGMDRLRGLERSGLVYHLKILYEFPKDVLAFTERGWAAQKQLLATLKADTRIEEVLSLVAFVPSFVRPSELSDLIPETAQRRSVSSDGRRVLFTVIPKESLDSDALLDLAYDLRKLPLPNIDSNSPGSILVAGLPAAIIDFLAVVRDWSAFVVIAIVCATLLALAIAFRSILIPLKAVILNLLTVAAAFGAVQWIFIEGYGASWLGLSGPLDGFFPSISLLIFCIVFGISMDYEIFLITRVAEERRKTRDEPEAIVEGLTRTGPVITHLAVVMAAVFGAFALSNFPPIQMLGVALAVAVLVDAIVVRMTISPALLRLAGRWNWWPND
jgi:RND superfamily putative drug exporter